MVEGPMLLVVLVLSIAFIVVMTSRFRVHAFLVLLLATIGVGVACGLPAAKIITTLKDGFGNTLAAIGVVILNGTILGVILSKTGAALRIATAFLRLTGDERSPLAVAITGYVAGIPIFCDSGYVVLSPLNKALAAQSKQSMTVMAVALAIPLYVIHCLVPPHPGPAAAAGVIGADVGKLILLGFLVGIPAVVAAYFWAVRFAGRYRVEPEAEATVEDILARYGKLPSLAHSLMPIVVPAALIGLGAFARLESEPFGSGTAATVVGFVGDPTIALTIGVLGALSLAPKLNREVLSGWVEEAVRSAGPILAITGAGGAFGFMLRTTPIGDYLGQTLMGWGLGLLLPFLVAAALKSAQGSSTVAVITTSSLMVPLMSRLGLDAGWNPLLVVLAMGAGSMVVSHANDSYFWVVSKFSGLEVSMAYKVYSTATLLVGLVTMAVIMGLYAVVG
jgi:GntP family gluconate:H+ symporter